MVLGLVLGLLSGRIGTDSEPPATAFINGFRETLARAFLAYFGVFRSLGDLNRFTV